jgi:hypothetical protein
MISKSSMIVLDRVTEYTKQTDGSWHADLRVPPLHVEGDSPNDCRYRMMDKFDALLADWLIAAQQSQEPRLFGE